MTALAIRRASSRSRSAYTLIEVMIVLAIMTVLFAVSLPMMRKPLAKSELVRAAQVVQSALADARISAIESGTAAKFQFQLESGRYQVVARRRPIPRPASTSPAEQAALSIDAQSMEMTSDSTADVNAETSLSGVSATDSQHDDLIEELAGTIQFVSETLLEERALESASQAEPGIEGSDLPVPEPEIPASLSSVDLNLASPLNALDGPVAVDWQTIRFYPDGSCESAEIVLVDEKYSLSIVVRGLTGGVRLGKPQLITAAAAFIDSANQEDFGRASNESREP